MEELKNETGLQTETTMTAGEMLRNARTTGRRKREILTIAKQLCIREEFLQALEDGNYTAIPELVYVLGFARNYAIELGLDPDIIVDKIKTEMGVTPDADRTFETEVAPVNKKTKTNSENKLDVEHMWQIVREFVLKHWRWIVIVFGGLVVAVFIVWAIITLVSDDNKSLVSSNESAESAITEIAEPAYNVPVRERFGTENRATAKIILQAVRKSWLKVEDTRGKTEISRVLVTGDVYYLPTGKTFTATFGDAGGVDVWVDGKLAPKQGADHVQKTGISLDAEKLMSADKKVDAKNNNQGKKVEVVQKSPKASEYGSFVEE